MKTVAWHALIALTCTTAAHAATLGMYWEDSATNTLQLNEGESTRIAIYVDLLAGEDFAGFGLAYSPISGDPIRQTHFEMAQPAWDPVGIDPALLNVALGRPSQGIAGFAANGAATLAGPGTFIIAYQTVILDHAGDLSDVPITFNHSGPPSAPWFEHPLLLASGTDYVWDARHHVTTAGYAAYGDWGNPGWSGPEGQPTPNPLILQRIPEPHTLALLALGAIAIRRRSLY